MYHHEAQRSIQASRPLGLFLAQIVIVGLYHRKVFSVMLAVASLGVGVPCPGLWAPVWAQFAIFSFIWFGCVQKIGKNFFIAEAVSLYRHNLRLKTYFISATEAVPLDIPHTQR